MRRLKNNYFNILKTKDCEYHHSLPVKRPRNFEMLVKRYQAFGNATDIVTQLRRHDISSIKRSKQGRKIALLFHYEMKFIKVWKHIIALLSIFALIELMANHLATDRIGTFSSLAGLWDCIWPNNPYSLSHLDGHTSLKVKVLTTLSFIVSLFFLADFFIIFMTVDKVLYSFVTMKELLKKKLAFQNEGASTMLHFLAIFLPSLKIYFLGKIGKAGGKFQQNVQICLPVTLLVVVCMYAARLGYYYAYNGWTKDTSFCAVFHKEWNNNPQKEIDRLCNQAPIKGWNQTCYHFHHLDTFSRAFSYYMPPEILQESSETVINKMGKVIEKIRLTLNLQHVCSKKWLGQDIQEGEQLLFEEESLWSYQLRTFLALWTIASLEGNDIISLFPNGSHFMVTLALCCYTGITILAIMNAVATATEKARHRPLVLLNSRLNSLRDAMKSNMVPDDVLQSLMNFLFVSTLDYNRITFNSERELWQNMSCLQKINSKDDHPNKEKMPFPQHHGNYSRFTLIHVP